MDPPPQIVQNLGGSEQRSSRRLSVLDSTKKHVFIIPVKRIDEGHDVPEFLTSRAYTDIGIFVMQLNIAMCPRKALAGKEPQTWPLDSDIPLPPSVRRLQELMETIAAIIEEAPPDPGPRRFGNVSFRKWFDFLESRVKDLLEEYLPKAVLEFKCQDDISVLDELTPYLMGGFGSAQRLDYGTGHELSFLAFLGCIWKLGGFTDESLNAGAVERAIVVGVIEPYLRVIRRLILTYTLEPAGSHGVWGLDDHSFLPYIFGSAQYCPAIADNEAMPLEGALPGTPNPGDIAKMKVVDRERKHNMYFSAVGFINDVKTGPFWEHSPILFDISGVRSGWGKINKGMIKMYNAEVLSKFPVVQHFLFGSLFSWEHDPDSIQAQTTIHHTSQPDSRLASSNAPTPRPQEGTRAPWASTSSTAAPWVRPAGSGGGTPSTRAPWASQSGSNMPIRETGDLPGSNAPTRAPWADKRG